MPRRRVGTEGSPDTRRRREGQDREEDLGNELKEIRLELGLLETMYQLEVIRRQNLVEGVLGTSTLEELQELKKHLKFTSPLEY